MARIEKCQECKHWKAHGQCMKDEDHQPYMAPDNWCGGFKQRTKPKAEAPKKK